MNKQIVHETKTLAISTVSLGGDLDMLDALLGWNPNRHPYESMVFNLVDGEPDFSSPIETQHYDSWTDAEAGHRELIKKYDPEFTLPMDS